MSKVIGSAKVHDLDGPGFATFGEAICTEIGKIVDVRLPETRSAYADLVNWITGTTRDYPVEIFTTNYDLLFEEAFESVRAPYFDGFTGGREPFFDPVSVSRSDLPARRTRLWKLHGSLGWRASSKGEVIRTGQSSASHLVFPEHLKYDQTQNRLDCRIAASLSLSVVMCWCLLVPLYRCQQSCQQILQMPTDARKRPWTYAGEIP